jgi:hypothetical protein
MTTRHDSIDGKGEAYEIEKAQPEHVNLSSNLSARFD